MKTKVKPNTKKKPTPKKMQIGGQLQAQVNGYPKKK